MVEAISHKSDELSEGEMEWKRENEAESTEEGGEKPHSCFV